MFHCRLITGKRKEWRFNTGCHEHQTSRKVVCAMANKSANTLLQIGCRVRELREARLLSQDDFARVVGCHRSQVSQVERGVKNLSVDTIERFALALGVEAASLLQTGPAVPRGAPESLPLRELVSQNIFSLRSAGGFAQDALSETAGLSRNYVSTLEVHKKNVSLSHLEKLASVLDVPISVLFERELPLDRIAGRSR
ncbi:helix-turn-helix domain-containing protein [Cupriavidus sp. BIC8F]|uniref:helix-turn-helix domain-containing protein n=1 Tax=Cupriavidus sp. BIC8F TaxID=3079014 RepID=UPI0029164A5C|nr:helix-turn-helix domain-containing protein [Cupriavidus sp. BIC8F]